MLKLPKLSKFKKIILLFIIFSLVLSVLPPIARAKYFPGSSLERESLYESTKNALETEGMNSLQWTLYETSHITTALIRLTTGLPILEGEEPIELGGGGGAIGTMTHLVNGLYFNQPVSSQEYFAYLGKNLEIVKPAYAQGQGWGFLQPVLDIWKGVRNTAYLFFIVVFVAVGFMIMFRKKMDPQTAISIQTALPKIIIALILVTFSYAICGLIVDIIFVGNGLIADIFGEILHKPGQFDFQEDIDIFTLIPAVAKDFVGGKYKTYYPSLNVWILGFFEHLLKALTLDTGSIIVLVISITFLGTLVKIFLALLGRYVMLLIYTIFSPLVFLWGSLPGQSDHLTRFFNSMLGTAITFPATMLMLNIANFFFKMGSGFGFGLIPPFTIKVPPTDPDFSVILAGLIAMGVLMMTAKIPEMIDDALGIKPGGIAPALGAEVGGGLRKIPVIGSLIG